MKCSVLICCVVWYNQRRMRRTTKHITARMSPTRQRRRIVTVSETEREIVLSGERVVYIHRVSARTRSVRASVFPDGRLVISTNPQYSDARRDTFIFAHTAWIKKHLTRAKKYEGLPIVKRTHHDYKKYKQDTLNLIHARLTHFNQHYKYTYHAVSVKNQKTRWGSCSKNGNLNFSYLLSSIRPELADYVIVHELCHLKEFNHSPRFWKLVAETIPNHKELRRELKRGLLIM